MNEYVVRPDEIGESIKQMRLENRLTLAEVSSRCGITVSHLFRLEAGQRRWNLEILEKILRAMKATICIVVGDVKTTTARCEQGSEEDESRLADER